MEKDQFYEIGRITKVHGNDGKVYVKLDVDDPSQYLELESVFFDLENKPVPFFIEYIRITPSGLLVKFEELYDRTVGSVGVIELIYDQTSQVLLGVNNKGKELLVPLVDEFEPYFNRDKNRLEINLPDGLLEIDES